MIRGDVGDEVFESMRVGELIPKQLSSLLGVRYCVQLGQDYVSGLTTLYQC